MSEKNSPSSSSKFDDPLLAEMLKEKLNQWATSNNSKESSQGDSQKSKQAESPQSQNPSSFGGIKASQTKVTSTKESNAFRGRGPWTEAEDNELIAFVKKYGAGNWKNVATLTNLNRDAQSCRLRWSSFLDPNVDKSPFTEEEDTNLMRLVKWEGDTKWVNIASEFFPNRTGYQLQSRWHVLMNKLRKTQFDSEQQQPYSPSVESPPTISLPPRSNFTIQKGSSPFSPSTPTSILAISSTVFPSSTTVSPSNRDFVSNPLRRFSPSSLSASTAIPSPLKSPFPPMTSIHSSSSSPRELSFPALKTLSSPLVNVSSKSSYSHEWPPNPKLMKYSAQEFQMMGITRREEGDKGLEKSAPAEEKNSVEKVSGEKLPQEERAPSGVMVSEAMLMDKQSAGDMKVEVESNTAQKEFKQTTPLSKGKETAMDIDLEKETKDADQSFGYDVSMKTVSKNISHEDDDGDDDDDEDDDNDDNNDSNKNDDRIKMKNKSDSNADRDKIEDLNASQSEKALESIEMHTSDHISNIDSKDAGLGVHQLSRNIEVGDLSIKTDDANLDSYKVGEINIMSAPASSIPASSPSAIPSLSSSMKYSFNSSVSASAVDLINFKKNDMDENLSKQEVKVANDKTRPINPSQGKTRRGYGSRRGWLLRDAAEPSLPRSSSDLSFGQKPKAFQFTKTARLTSSALKSKSGARIASEKEEKITENFDLDLELNLGRKDDGSRKREREETPSFLKPDVTKRLNSDRIHAESSGHGQRNTSRSKSFPESRMDSQSEDWRMLVRSETKDEVKDDELLAFDEFINMVSDSPALKLALEEDMKTINDSNVPEERKSKVLKKILSQISHLKQSKSSKNMESSPLSNKELKKVWMALETKSPSQTPGSTMHSEGFKKALMEERKKKVLSLLPASPIPFPPSSTKASLSPGSAFSQKYTTNTLDLLGQTNPVEPGERNQYLSELESDAMFQVEKLSHKYAEVERNRINELLQNNLLKCGLFSARDSSPSNSPLIPLDKRGGIDGGNSNGGHENRESIRPQQSLVSVAAKILTGGERKDISEAEKIANQVIVEIAAKYELGKKLFEMTSQNRKFDTD